MSPTLNSMKRKNGVLYVPASLQQTKSGKFCYSNRYNRAVSSCLGEVNDSNQYGYFRADNNQQQSDDDRYTHYFFIPAATSSDLADYDDTAVIRIPDDITEPVDCILHSSALAELNAPASQPSVQPSV